MKKIFTLLSLFITCLVCSQEVLVPFRVGDKFGLSDINGKMKLEPKYDFINPEKDGNFTFSNKETSGLISGNKEIITLPGEYKFEVVKGKFIVAKAKIYVKDERGRERKESRKKLFTLKGKPIINKEYKNISLVHGYGSATESDYIIFIVHIIFNDDDQAVYVFDSQKQKITQTLFSKLSGIEVTKRNSVNNEVLLNVFSKEGKYEKFLMDYNGGSVVISPSDGKNLPVAGTGHGGPKVEMADRDYMNAVPTPDREMSGKIGGPRKNYYNTLLALDRNIVTVVYKGYYSQKEIKSEKVELPGSSTDIKLGAWLQTFESSDKSQNVYNYVTYSVNGKKGLLITDSLHIKPAYDELTLVKFKKGNSNFPALIVGNKDKAGNMKYGIISEKGEALVPMQYDKIDYLLDETYSRGQSVKTLEDYMIVQKDRKYGIINYKNVELLPVKYTEIIRKSDSYAITYTLRNGDKYGILKFEMNVKKDFADALFPYPVGFVLKDYAGIKGKEMIWLEKDDRLFCYARPDGFLYYKP